MKKPFIKGITLTIFVGLLTVIVLQQGNFFEEEPKEVKQPKEETKSVEDLKLPESQHPWGEYDFPEPPKSFASVDSTFTHVIKPKEIESYYMSTSKSTIVSSSKFIRHIIPALDPRKLTRKNADQY